MGLGGSLLLVRRVLAWLISVPHWFNSGQHSTRYSLVAYGLMLSSSAVELVITFVKLSSQ